MPKRLTYYFSKTLALPELNRDSNLIYLKHQSERTRLVESLPIVRQNVNEILVSKYDQVPVRQSSELMFQNFTIEHIDETIESTAEPSTGDQITIAYEARLLTGSALNGQVIESEAEFKFILGNRRAPKCLELAVKEMSLHQQVIVSCTQDQLLVPKTAKQPILGTNSDIYIQYSVQLLAIVERSTDFAESRLVRQSSV